MRDLNRIIDDLGRSGLLSGLAGGLAGGALTGALASKKGRKVGKAALKVGALAAVSGLAWKAYQSYRRDDQPVSVAGSPGAGGLTRQRFHAVADDTPGNPGPLLLLRAMITAAHADGHLDGAERARIFDRVAELDLSSSDKALLFDELQRPMSIDALAEAAPDQEAAIEVYVASVLTVDSSQPDSATYLRRLAARLALPAGVVNAVHQEASPPAAGAEVLALPRRRHPAPDFDSAA